MKLNLVIQALDRATAPIRKIERATGGLGSMLRRTKGDASGAGRALDAVGRAARVASIGVIQMTGRVARLAGNSGLLALRKSADLAKSALGGTLRLAGRLGIGLGLAGVASTGLFASSIVGIAGRFEQFQVMLEGVLGSSARAKAAMNWVRKFAQETPYEMEEVTAAFVRARGVGIDPMSGALRKMGDAASGNNKTLMEAVEAIADAQTGEFERLKEFLITTSVKGNQVKFSYLTKAGKSASKTVRKDMASIREAVLGIFDERNGGGMVRQSRTLFGIWRNLKDMISGFQLDIAAAGSFDFLKSKLIQLQNRINAAAADGGLQRMARRISDAFVRIGTVFFNFLEKTDWNQFGARLRTTAEGIWYLARAVAALARAGALLDKINVVRPISRFAINVGQSLGKGRGMPNIAQPIRSPATGPAINAAGRPSGRAGRSVAVGGHIDINVWTGPNAHTRVTGASSANRHVPIRVNRGRSMASSG